MISVLALPVLLALSAAPQGRVLVVERSSLQVSAATAVKLRERLARAFADARLSPQLVGERCASRECLLSLARDADAAVVGVTLVKSRQGLTVDLEAVDATAVLLQSTLVLSTERLDTSPEVQLFAHQLAAKLLLDRPVADDPKPALVPDAPTEAPLVLAQAPSTAPKVVGGVSAGLGALGIGLLVAGLVVKGGLEGALSEQPVVTTITRAQAEQQAALANGLVAGGAVAIGLGVAGAATAMGLRFAEATEPIR